MSSALWRARLSRRMSRRRALQAMGLGAAGLAGAALLGCGGGEEEAVPTATPSLPSPTPTVVEGEALERIDLEQVELFGEELSAPEGVVVASDGTVWASENRRGAVTAIAADGQMRRIEGLGGNPNGICMDLEGNVIVANVGGGWVQRVYPDGRHEIIADSVDGRPFTSPNFPLVDSQGNIYVSISTWRADSAEAFTNPAPDGAVVRISPDGLAEVLAEGFIYANGLALTEDESALFVAQTTALNVMRVPLGPDGNVGSAEHYGPDLGETGLPDGLALDSRGNLYVALVTMNAVGVITPEGEFQIILEDPDAEKIRNPSNIAFGGPDLRDAYIGSLGGTSLPRFRAQFPGMPLAHQRGA
jgi:gluconolactonase